MYDDYACANDLYDNKESAGHARGNGGEGRAL